MNLPLLGQLELPFAPTAAPQEARRQIALRGRMVSYQLVRARRRSLGITIDHRGLRVGAPRSASLREIEEFLRQHDRWVVSKLDEWQGAEGQPRVSVTTGTVIPVLGRPVRLVIRPGEDRSTWREGELRLEVSARRSPRDALTQTLKSRALSHFAERAVSLAPRIPVEMPRLALSTAQTRWGSCCRASGVRINWRLIHLSEPLIDYVIAHELAHLVEMNHSARFWAVVERAMPGCREIRRELERAAPRIPRF